MSKRTFVKNEFGKELDFEAAVALMDDDICEELHAQLAPCTDQQFFDAYTKAHEQKFEEKWELTKANPQW